MKRIRDKKHTAKSFCSIKNVICILALICLTIASVITLIKPPQKYISEGNKVKGQEPIEENILPGDELIQTFVADDDYARIGFSFANYDKIIHQGTLEVELLGADGEKQNCSKELHDLQDSTFAYCDFVVKKNVPYKARLTVDNSTDPITFFSGESEDDGALSINGKKQDKVIIMSFSKLSNNYFTIWYYAMVAAIIVCYMVLAADKEFYVKEK